MALFSQYAIAAAHEALESAGLLPFPADEAANAGVILGSGIGNFDDVYSSALRFDAGGHHRTSPLFVPRLLINMAAGHVSMRHGLCGPVLAPATACTTGLHAIAQAHHLIAHCPPSTAPNLIIAGASEACVHPLAMSGFARARSLSTAYNDLPERASRPFDAARDGFVIAEGAAVLVLEEREHALARGAHVVAEVGGAGMSGDAAHMTAPRADGAGARLAMGRALAEAGDLAAHLGREWPGAASVDYVNAHATGTAVGDAAEAAAVRALMADVDVAAGDVCVSSTKGATGHLLGAAGSLEAVFTALAVKEGIVPPTLNLEQPGEVATDGGNMRPPFDLNFARGKALKRDVRMALTNSFGFGGTNASLCLLKHED